MSHSCRALVILAKVLSTASSSASSLQGSERKCSTLPASGSCAWPVSAAAGAFFRVRVVVAGEVEKRELETTLESGDWLKHPPAGNRERQACRYSNTGVPYFSTVQYTHISTNNPRFFSILLCACASTGIGCALFSAVARRVKMAEYLASIFGTEKDK